MSDAIAIARDAPSAGAAPSIGAAYRAVRDRFRAADLDTPELDARAAGRDRLRPRPHRPGAGGDTSCLAGRRRSARRFCRAAARRRAGGAHPRPQGILRPRVFAQCRDPGAAAGDGAAGRAGARSAEGNRGAAAARSRHRQRLRRHRHPRQRAERARRGHRPLRRGARGRPRKTRGGWASPIASLSSRAPGAGPWPGAGRST